MLQGRGREITLSANKEPREKPQRMSPGAVMIDTVAEKGKERK